jgi:hypothetical protein
MITPSVRLRNFALVIVVCFCLFHVLAVMGYLLREGRLSVVPIYDDVVYLIDGLKRLSVFDQSGLGGFFADFYTHPAHAPFTALASTFGLLLSNGSVWGPYFLNGLWVVLVAFLALFILRDLNVWSSVGIVVAILPVPMFGSVVAEFRPDPVWGILIGFSLAAMVTIDLVHARQSHLLGLGILFGAAVLAKPTASPASIVILGLGFIVQMGLTLWCQRPWSIGEVARKIGIVTLGASLLIIPYVITNGLGILQYILTVMGADKEVWRTKTSVLGHFSYYLNRGVGPLMLGWIWYLAVPVILACAGVLIYAREKRSLISLAALLSALAAAYVIVSVSEVKSLMIGSILYGLIIATVTWSLGQLVNRISSRHVLVLILGVAVFVTQWVPRAGMIQRADPAMAVTDKATKAVFPEFLAALQKGERKTALVTVPGPVYAGTLDFLARQQGVARDFQAGYTWNTWEMFSRGVASSDVIVLSEPGMVGQALGFNFPSVAFQARLLDALRANSEFTGRSVFTDAEGNSVWLFVRK